MCIPADTTAGTLITLRDGEPILLSRATPDDAASLVDLLLRLTARTVRLRYHSSRSFALATAWAEAERMIRGAATLIALPVRRVFGEVVAVGELVPDLAAPKTGHLGLVVRDDWQGRGLGSALVGELRDLAPALGIGTLRADLLAENEAALRLLARQRLPIAAKTRRGETEVLIHLPPYAGGAGGGVPAST